MSPVGTPVVKMHFEAHTDECICTRVIDGCGGIVSCEINCPEHGLGVESVPIHTHRMQVPGTSVGTLVL